jgi:hypothetical protein
MAIRITKSNPVPLRALGHSEAVLDYDRELYSPYAQAAKRLIISSLSV